MPTLFIQYAHSILYTTHQIFTLNSRLPNKILCRVTPQTKSTFKNPRFLVDEKSTGFRSDFHECRFCGRRKIYQILFRFPRQFQSGRRTSTRIRRRFQVDNGSIDDEFSVMRIRVDLWSSLFQFSSMRLALNFEIDFVLKEKLDRNSTRILRRFRVQNYN